jgi:hypothetical protein
MNATADSGENPELPGPNAPGVPLSAPVAATVLPAREVNAHSREPDGRSRYAEPDGPPRFAESDDRPHLGEPDDRPHFGEPDDRPRFDEPDDRPRFDEPDDRPRPDVSAPARPSGHGPRPGAHAPSAARPAQAVPASEPGHDPAPAGGTPADDWSPAGVPEDPERVSLREQLDAVRVKAASASSWLETSVHYARLLNRDGIVPVTARFSRDDIEFLGRAREEVLGFAELGLRLLELHAPLDAGGISTDPASPILRCRSCMWRWPCPTFRMLTDALSHLPPAGPPPAR